jgi:hypothetical protein
MVMESQRQRRTLEVSRLVDLDYTQITSVLSYKPGWFYTFEPGVRDKVVIHAKVEDSHQPGVMVNFKMGRVIPSVVRNSTQAFVDWVHDITIEAEIHEVNEFFRFAGELLYDPHRVTPVEQS